MAWGGDLVRGEHFSDHMLGWLFDKTRDLLSKGKAEIIGLDRIAQTYGTLYADLGGIKLLAELVDEAPPAQNAGDYARIVLDGHVRRSATQACRDATKDLLSQRDRPAGEILAGLRSAVEQIEATGAVDDAWTDAGSAVRVAMDAALERSGRIDFPTGIASLDTFTGGLHAGEVTICAARPGMGKSIAGLTIGRAVAREGRGVAVFSLEMTKDATALRLACDVAYSRGSVWYGSENPNPTFDLAMKGQLPDGHWRRIRDAGEEIARLPIEIDDRSALTMAQIETSARRLFRRWERKGIKPGLIVIDHLGKVRPTTDRRGAKNAEVADVSGDTQAMAKRLGVPVLALVQLNRGVESRDDKRPMLADLRQAGELEEDARQVLFLYRPEYYLREPVGEETFEERTERLTKLDACRNQLFWLVEKNSHGPRGQVKSFCDIGSSAIREW